MRTDKRKFLNILFGIGSVLDVWPVPLRRRRRLRPRPSPCESLCRDGAKVGQDMRTAVRRLPKSVGAVHD
jgi:hypothetical protein